MKRITHRSLGSGKPTAPDHLEKMAEKLYQGTEAVKTWCKDTIENSKNNEDQKSSHLWSDAGLKLVEA